MFKISAKTSRASLFWRMSLILDLLLLLASLVAASGSSCDMKLHGDSTTYTLKPNVKSCSSYSWLRNKIVEANEENLNTQVVHSRGSRFITLHSCYNNVLYRNICTGTLENCSTSCPTTSTLKEDTSTYDGRSSTSAVHLHAVIGFCIAGLVLYILGVL